jgi:hypothetical protein
VVCECGMHYSPVPGQCPVASSYEHSNELISGSNGHLGSIRSGRFRKQLSNCQLLREGSARSIYFVNSC